MVQASTASILFLTEVFGLCTYGPHELFPRMEQASLK